MIKVYWLDDLTLAYILDHAVCCASAASSGRSLQLIISQLRTKYSSSNYPNHVRRTMSSIKKRSKVRRILQTMFGEANATCHATHCVTLLSLTVLWLSTCHATHCYSPLFNCVVTGHVPCYALRYNCVVTGHVLTALYLSLWQCCECMGTCYATYCVILLFLTVLWLATCHAIHCVTLLSLTVLWL